MDTSLTTDLGLVGTELEAVLKETSEQFEVDLSEIDTRYTEDEFAVSLGMVGIIFIPVIWPWMLVTGKGKKYELLVGDLLKAVLSGRWSHPERPAKFPWERLRKNANKFKP